MADLDVETLASMHRVIVIAATWGEGEPPGRAARAYNELMGEGAPRLDGIEFGVLALGDTAYAEFCATGRKIDERLAALGHADDTTVPVLAKMKTVTGRIWTYVRDDRPFGGKDPPAAVFRYSRTRAGEHPQEHLASYVGIMQADAFAGFNPLYDAKRRPAPIIEAACWSHGRRYFFKLAQENKAPIAIEAVRRIDELFEIERTINGLTPPQRVAVRQAKSKPLVADLEVWLRQKLALLSSKSDTAKAINYSLTVGTRLPASLMTVASASQTTQQSFRSAVWPSEEKIGPSRVPMPGATEQPRSIPSSRHACVDGPLGARVLFELSATSRRLACARPT
jgi:hypothetical protein